MAAIVGSGVGMGAAGAVRGPVRVRGGSGFRVPEGADMRAEGAESGGEAGAVAGVAMPSLLAMQEAESGAVQDREARRHGEAVLESLTELQRALLTGASGGELARLAGLARAMPAATDPRLAAVQRALLVRVAVEQARLAADRR